MKIVKLMGITTILFMSTTMGMVPQMLYAAEPLKAKELGQITLEIHLPHRITAEHSERLLKVAHDCTVHQSLVVAPNVAIALNPHSHAGSRPSGGKITS
jgi:hypothetical protein